MLGFLTDLFYLHKVSMYSAKLSGTLFDLNIDTKKLDQEAFLNFSEESYKKSLSRESAAIDFVTKRVLGLGVSSIMETSTSLDIYSEFVKDVIRKWEYEGKIVPFSADSLYMAIDMAQEKN